MAKEQLMYRVYMGWLIDSGYVQCDDRKYLKVYYGRRMSDGTIGPSLDSPEAVVEWIKEQ